MCCDSNPKIFPILRINVELESNIIDLRDHLFGRVVTEHRSHRRIYAQETAFGRALKDPNDRIVEYSPVLCLGFAKVLLYLYASCDISG